MERKPRLLIQKEKNLLLKSFPSVCLLQRVDPSPILASHKRGASQQRLRENPCPAVLAAWRAVRSLLRVLLAVRLDKPDCPGAHVFSSVLSEKWKEVTYFCFVTGVSFLLALPCGMQDLNSWVRNLMGVLGESAESCPWTSREALGSWF